MKTLTIAAICMMVSCSVIAQVRELKKIEPAVKKLLTGDEITARYVPKEDTCAESSCEDKFNIIYTVSYFQNKHFLPIVEAAHELKKILSEKNLIKYVKDIAVSLEFPASNMVFYVIILQNP